MKTARFAAHKAILAITVLAVALVLPVNAWASAGSPQICTVGSNCEIGEFLYDDNYAPINSGASCTITSRYPNGSSYLNSQALSYSGDGDGWYSYTISSVPSTTGMYRTQITCTVNGQDMSIDKSFEVQENTSPSSNDIATAVWGYSGRSLDNVSSLVSSIWSYSTRSLSSFSSLVTSIWSNSSRSLTQEGLDNGKNLATQDDTNNISNKVDTITSNNTTTTTDTSDIKKTVQQNRLLLERLVNKPVVETVLENQPTPDLNSKINDTQDAISSLNSDINDLYSKSQSLSYRSSSQTLLDQVLALNNEFGEEADTNTSKTVFGQINYLKNSWNWQEADSAFKTAQSIKRTLQTMQVSLSAGNGTSSYQTNNLVANISSLRKLIGSSSDASYKSTLYARLNETKQLADALDQREKDVDSVLAAWTKTEDKNSLQAKINDLSKKIIAINRLPNVSTILANTLKDISPEKILKNKVLALRGVVQTNKILLAKGAGQSFATTWLEEGSLVFKTVATNPSNLISQDVEVKFYLPAEVKKEDIISTDDGLTVEYDSDKGQYYVDGTYHLTPGETKTVSVRVTDVWTVNADTIASMRNQADELSKPLEKTAYFAQGVTLKSDINASLDKAQALLADAVTPEQKISAYRDAEIEIKSAQDNLKSLQDLVTQAGSAGTLFGFVGGAQTLAVWGLIIIMAAGFVFLALYMRTIQNGGVKTKSKSKSKKGKKEKETQEPKVHGGYFGNLVKAAVPFLVFGAMTATASGVIVAKLVGTKSDQVLGDQTTVQTQNGPDDTKVATQSAVLQEPAVGGIDIVRVNVPEGSSVNLRSGPSLNAPVVKRIVTSLDAERLGADGDWTNISISNDKTLDPTTELWVSNQFIEEGSGPNVSTNNATDLTQTATITDTPTGWLNVRKAPDGEILTKIYPGDSYPVVSEKDGWLQIQFGDGTTGWISASYASVK